MYAIDYITDFNERYGNLDFKTYNRNSVACNTLETLTDEQYKLNYINEFDYNLLIIPHLNYIINNPFLVNKYDLIGVLPYFNCLTYVDEIIKKIIIPVDRVYEMIQNVNEYGENKHKVIMKNNYITAPYYIYSSAFTRHYSAWIMGEELDESGLSHEAHCWWNLIALILILIYDADKTIYKTLDNTIFKVLEKQSKMRATRGVD